MRGIAAAVLLLAAGAGAQETSPTVLLLPADNDGITAGAAESVRAQVVRSLEALGARVEALPDALFPAPPRGEEDFVRARHETYSRGAAAFAVLTLHDREDSRQDVALLRLINVQGQMMELGAAGHLGNVATIPDFPDRLQELWRELADGDRVRRFLANPAPDRMAAAVQAARANPRSVALLLERRIREAESRLSQLTPEQQANWRAEILRVRRGADLGRDEWAFGEFERLLRESKGAPAAHVPPDAAVPARLAAFESLLASAVLWGGLQSRPAEMEVLLERHRAAVLALDAGDEGEAGAIVDGIRANADRIVRDVRASLGSR